MKTKSGYETDGTFLLYQSGFTKKWIIERESGINTFDNRHEALSSLKEITCDTCKFNLNQFCKHTDNGSKGCEVGIFQKYEPNYI